MFNLGGWSGHILLSSCSSCSAWDKLPEIGGAIGKSIREFREASKDEPRM